MTDDTPDPAASALDEIRAAAMTGDQVAAYLEHVRALIKTSQSKPGDTETEHVIVTELFPGFVAAVEAALKLADEWDAPVPEYDDRMNVRQDCAVRLHEAITAALAGKEAGDE